MDKLLIPKGCVIQGEISAISNDGDIEIEGALTPDVLHSGSGGIKFITANVADCDKIVAEKGLVEVEAPSLTCSKLTAQSLHLKTGPLVMKGDITVEGELFLSTEDATLTRCAAGSATISSKQFHASSLQCEGEVTLTVEHAKIDTIHARKVVISGGLECKRIMAQEGIMVESGKIAIKSVECPSFHASPEVTGIVMVANCEEVRAEGVRGFLHPSELGLLSDDDGVVSIPTADLTAMATATEPETEPEPPVSIEDVPPIIETMEPEPDTEALTSPAETSYASENNPTVTFVPPVEDEDTNPEPLDVGGTVYMTAVPDEEGTVELADEDLADEEGFGITTAPMEQAIDVLDPTIDDTDLLDAEQLSGEDEILDPESEILGESVEDPLDGLDMHEPLETDELGDLGEVAEALDEADELNSEDLEAMETELAAEEMISEVPSEENPTEVLARDLTVILDEIRGYFPADNIPNSISQIQRYIDESRFNLFAKSRNKEAVLSNFDKFDHPAISQLVRSFFSRVEQYVDDTTP